MVQSPCKDTKKVVILFISAFRQVKSIMESARTPMSWRMMAKGVDLDPPDTLY